MLEKYRGKEVRMLVSSDSGAGTGVATSGIGSFVALSTVITVSGVVNDLDNKFLEIKNSKISYINDFNRGFSEDKSIEPTEFENDITLVNVDKIISISII